MTTKDKINRAVYPGTFDPITNGHFSLIERATHLFDELIVAVVKNGSKDKLFNLSERINLIEQSVQNEPFNHKVTVIGFDGLLAEFAVKNKAKAIIRGLRAVSDFENEFQMALMNRKIARNVETIFLMPSLSWVYLSSTIVKDVAQHGGNISGLVPMPVRIAFNNKLATTE